MQWQASAGINNAKEEIANANHPQIRFFNTQRIAADFPQQNCFGTWTVCSPETMKDFSAVGYFFGRRLQAELNVPVGLINSSWGGSPIEIWMREEVVNSNEILRTDAAKRIAEWSPVKPGAAYNTMITPFLSMPIAGVIWYQGESNVDHPDTYAMLMKNLIESWRADWKLNFPFYYVQLAPCHYNGGKYQAALIREQQTKALQIFKTGMVVTTDLVKDTNNIHPTNKQDVGLRLANLALTETYGKEGIASKSPMYKSCTITKNKVVLTFNYVKKGFKVNGKDVTGFQIAGEDRKFETASVKIDGNNIIVYSKNIKNPVAVRFGFGNASVPNLFSAEGLPVAPFRTDDWDVKLGMSQTMRLIQCASNAISRVKTKITRAIPHQSC
jgi:sialate O-acetylesterase